MGSSENNRNGRHEYEQHVKVEQKKVMSFFHSSFKTRQYDYMQFRNSK
jgi:hypothetical protein